LKAPNAHKYNKNIIINKGKFAVWRSLDFSKKADLKNIKFGKEYTAKYEYYHPNGQKYFSLYDNKNKWMGYINTRSVTVKK
ncbi:serine protease, partial [Staphylococcus pseudintermedius]|nr:serine protease [Staphylococcus pseudintermedius]